MGRDDIVIDYKLIGDRIKTLRLKRGLTQDQLAEMVDITTIYLSRIENGHAKPTLDIYALLCDKLQCDLGHIFCAASTESPNYQCDKVLELFQSCALHVKPIALSILEQLIKIR